MRLKDRNTEPSGGWRYKYQDSFKNWYHVTGTSLNDLINKVRRDMRTNSVAIPENLQAYIEDYLCAYMPKGKCIYENKLGDNIARVAHTFAGGVDSTLARIGIKTNLLKAAQQCVKCGKRRMNYNGN